MLESDWSGGVRCFCITPRAQTIILALTRTKGFDQFSRSNLLLFLQQQLLHRDLYGFTFSMYVFTYLRDPSRYHLDIKPAKDVFEGSTVATRKVTVQSYHF